MSIPKLKRYADKKRCANDVSKCASDIQTVQAMCKQRQSGVNVPRIKGKLVEIAQILRK